MKQTIKCVCGHVRTSHRPDPNDPYVAERCVTCGCAGFDDGRPSNEDENEIVVLDEEAAR